MGDILEPVEKGDHDVIRLGVGRPPKAECSCGWSTKPSENLFELGSAAFDHSATTGHVLRRMPGDE
ncbi:hypothetical protein SEA_SCHWARTZ33_74 [Gordonia phage Schwartz33]|nr:hypothetical protein SEA_SCHWARTZ33_74 [Gordonia phage Schwartz33]